MISTLLIFQSRAVITEVKLFSLEVRWHEVICLTAALSVARVPQIGVISSPRPLATVAVSYLAAIVVLVGDAFATPLISVSIYTA